MVVCVGMIGACGSKSKSLVKDDYFIFVDGRKIASTEDSAFGINFSEGVGEYTSNQLETKRGIQIGDNLEKIKDAYKGNACMVMPSEMMKSFEYPDNLSSCFLKDLSDYKGSDKACEIVYFYGLYTNDKIVGVNEFQKSLENGDFDFTGLDEVGILQISIEDGYVIDIELIYVTPDNR